MKAIRPQVPLDTTMLLEFLLTNGESPFRMRQTGPWLSTPQQNARNCQEALDKEMRSALSAITVNSHGISRTSADA